MIHLLSTMDIPVLSNLLKLQLGKLQMCCFFLLGLALVVAWPIVFMSIKVNHLINRVPHTESILNISPPFWALIHHMSAHLWNLKGKLLWDGGMVGANTTHLFVARLQLGGTASVRIQIFESTLAKSTNGYVIAEVGMWLCAIYQEFQFIQVLTVFYQKSFIFVYTLFMHEKHLSICFQWCHLERFQFCWGCWSITIYS